MIINMYNGKNQLDSQQFCFPVSCLKQGLKLFCATESDSSETSEENVEEDPKSDQHYLYVESSEEEGKEEEAAQEIYCPQGRLRRHTGCRGSSLSKEEIVKKRGLPPLKVDSYFRHGESSDDTEIEEEIDHCQVKKDGCVFLKDTSFSEEEIEEEPGLVAAKNDSYFKDSELSDEEEIQEELGHLQVRVSCSVICKAQLVFFVFFNGYSDIGTLHCWASQLRCF